MKETLKPGLDYRHQFLVPESKLVRNLYPEAESFQDFPEVFATGFLVGLLEWACIELIAPHLDEGEGSLGIHVDVSHQAATPPGMTITVDTTLERVEKRILTFTVQAHDGQDLICRGSHRRAIIDVQRFKAKVAEKAALSN